MSSVSNVEQEARVSYCKTHNVHHLFELMATKVLLDRPENVFAYLRELLTKVEESEKTDHSHDPTKIQSSGHGGQLKITIAAFGLDNAGKTSLVAAMGGQIEPDTQPTVGFSPTQFETEKYDLCVFDLGGAKNFRGIWTHYLHDCHAIIYVVDGSDEARMSESLRVFKDLVANQYLAGKPVLLFVNKKDKQGFVPIETVTKLFITGNESLAPGTETKVLATTALKVDSAVDEGVAWLLGRIEKTYDSLVQRVVQDTAAVKASKRRT